MFLSKLVDKYTSFMIPISYMIHVIVILLVAINERDSINVHTA